MKKQYVWMKTTCVVFVLVMLCLGQVMAEPCGDVNSDGLINIVDAMKIAQFYVELNPENFDKTVADVSEDGMITITDALIIARFYVGLVESLPECGNTPTDGPTPECVTYEKQAEDAQYSSGSKETNHDGYTGTGFVNTNNASGEWIEWSIEVADACNATCVFRYATGGGARPMDLTINGTDAVNLAFSGSSAWNDWQTETMDVILTGGVNAIRLTATNSGGAPNMDKMDITICEGEVVTPTPTAPPPTQTPDPTPTPDPTDVPPGWTPPPFPDREFDVDVPMGWAVVQRHGLEGTTGGGGGEIVNVSSYRDLENAVSGSEPRIVRFSGSISGGRIDIGSNKTVIGVGDNATLDGQLNCDTSRNVIIRNFNIHGGADGIQVTDDSYHIWIDHCSLWDCGDGLLDLKGRSDCYLITWTHFFDHNKCNLLNSGSRNYDDRGFINGTLHHNFYDGTVQRNPRAGFGMIHIFNDYNFENSSYGIGFHTESRVFAEKNYFHNMDNSINQMYNSSGYDPEELGDCLAVDNYFDNASGDESTGIGFDPNVYYLYDFFLDEAQAVKDIVLAGAGTGAKYGEIGLLPIPGQGCVGVESSILKWKTGTVTPISYNVYFGTTTTPPEVLQTSDTSYDAGPLSSGTQYYWAVDQVTANGIVPGKLWTFVAK